MKLIEVEAVEDRSRAEGGHAVILLRGVERAPPDVTFTLKPVVAEGDDEGETPSPGLRDLRAIDVTITADGMALSVGPEVAESTLFVPGAVVEISLAELGVRGEFLWPAITPLARPKRRNIMIRRDAADPLLRPMAPSVPPPVAAVPVALVPEVGAGETDLRRFAPVSGSSVKAVEAEPAPATANDTSIDRARTVAAGRTVAQAEQQLQSAARRPIVLSSAVPRRALAEASPASEDKRNVTSVETTVRQPHWPEPDAAVPDHMPREGRPGPAREMHGAEAHVGASLSERPRHTSGRADDSAPALPVPAEYSASIWVRPGGGDQNGMRRPIAGS
jgi:hypothetical protein